LAAARQLGRTGGRKRLMTDSKIESAKKLLANGVPPRDVAKNLGVSVPTLYRWIPAATHFVTTIMTPCNHNVTTKPCPTRYEPERLPYFQAEMSLRGRF
jgi:transposase-like protein